MLLDEEDYKLLKKAGEITITDYGIMKLINGEYFIRKDDLMVLIEDLIDSYERLKEKSEEE